MNVNPEGATDQGEEGRSARGGASAAILALLSDADRASVEEAVGQPIRWCATPAELVRSLGEGPWAATLVALEEDGRNVGVEEELVRRIADDDASGILFLFSRDRSVERVLAAEAWGAAAVLDRPPDPDTVAREVEPIVRETGSIPVPGGVSDQEEEAGIGGQAGPIVGTSRALREVFRVVGRVAPTSATVLVTGASGTGKELVARALHRRSRRAEGPFVPINCAAIPESLLEAELFGHEKGAFTGAVARSEGRFGRADGGTLFLDEVGEMSLGLQARLLRVLETGEVERVGARDVTRVDVRIIAATNRDLGREIEEGRFREDLFFRLAVVDVELPPLRARPEDIRPLALHFAAHFAERHRRPIHHFSGAALECLEAHTWPGNVRELRNVLDRAVLMARGGVIRTSDLRIDGDGPRTSPVEPDPLAPFYPPTLSLRDVESRHIRRVLRHTRGHMGDAAEILGIHRNTMTAKVRDYEIDVDALTSGP